MDDIANYLDKYRNVVNGISILDRSFVEMPILKPIFCALALVSIHISKPFQALLIDVSTNYSILSIAFPKLYEELKTSHTIDICSTTIQAFKFVSKDIFMSCIPNKAVCQAIDDCILVHKEEIIPLIRLII